MAGVLYSRINSALNGNTYNETSSIYNGTFSTYNEAFSTQDGTSSTYNEAFSAYNGTFNTYNKASRDIIPDSVFRILFLERPGVGKTQIINRVSRASLFPNIY
jgi:hypothetical protein